MGSSDKAGNRGLPATPRDGAAVEIQGLALYITEQLGKLFLSHQNFFPYSKIKSKFYIHYAYKLIITNN